MILNEKKLAVWVACILTIVNLLLVTRGSDKVLLSVTSIPPAITHNEALPYLAQSMNGASPLYTFQADKIAIVQMADEKHVESNKYSINSVKCWAEKNGYQHIVTDPKEFPLCAKQLEETKEYWHSQLCALNEIMIHNLETIDYVVKLDTDVIAGVSERGIEHFLDGADFVVQERLYTGEINAGAYSIRNSPHGRHILKSWYEWPKHHGLGPGYRGGDNGSIHQVINSNLQIKGSEICQQKYDAIQYLDPLTTYFEYVACTREFLGPPRRHMNPYSGVRVTVWPAGYGPMMDHHIIVSAPRGYDSLDARGAYLFVHGLKTPVGDQGTMTHFGDPIHWGETDFFDGHCLKWNPPADNEILAQEIPKNISRGYAQRIGDIDSWMEIGNRVCFLLSASEIKNNVVSNFHFRVPRWNLYDNELSICQEDYWKCRPLNHDEYSEVPGWKCTEPHDLATNSPDGRDFNPVELTNIGPYIPDYDT